MRSSERRGPGFYFLAAFFVLFLLSAWAYGAAAGTIKDHRELVKMMAGAMEDLHLQLRR